MSRLNRLFEQLTRHHRAGFAAFITVGDPNVEQSLNIARQILSSGTDLLELGMPFSDPMAEGPSIQASSQRALAAGTKMKDVFSLVHALRERGAKQPIILMGYYNPILSYGVAKWAKQAALAGADGAIIVDLPPEEDQELRLALREQERELSLIRLISPTSFERLPILLKEASGFLYYVSITGTTGAARPDFGEAGEKLNRLRQASALPIALGFGIKTPEDSKAAAQIADLVVVGSALVDLIYRASAQPTADQLSAIDDFVRAHQSAIAAIKKNSVKK